MTTLPYRRQHGARAMVATLAISLLAACSTVGPDFVAPTAALPAQWNTHGAAAAPAAGESADGWWRQFADPVLDDLVQQALAANLDIRLATSRLRQSRIARAAIRAQTLPTVEANTSYQRTAASANGLMGLAGIGSPEASQMADGTGYGNAGVQGSQVSTPFDLYQYGFDASWELDLWGRKRRQLEAADALIQASGENADDARVAVAAETFADYVQLRANQASLQIATQSLQLAHASLQMQQRRQAEGAATALDVITAQQQIAALESTLPAYSRQHARLVNALSVLAAANPGALADKLQAVRPLPPLPATLPISLPSELARTRPDIRAAEARLHAATASIGVAKADFYPSVTLSGSLGQQSMSAASLGSWASRQFAVGPSLHLPIFEGGRLRAQLELRQEQQQEAGLLYQRTVLQAWSDVDDALSALAAQKQTLDAVAARLEHGKAAWQLAQARQSAGAGTRLQVLQSERDMLAEQLAWVDSQASVSLAAARLYKSLGGGWQSAQASPRR